MPCVPALVLAAFLAAPAAPAPRATQYVLVESRKSVSPAGERASAVRGAVTVFGGKARWDLETGTFPRTSANTLVLEEKGGWLLDRKGKVAARVDAGDVRALFVPTAEGDAGPFQSAVRGVEVSGAEIEAGAELEGRPTTRLTVTAAWSVVTSAPGRVSRIRSRLKAVVDALREPSDETRSPLDDLARLLDVPEAVREALGPELARSRGFPVRVAVEVESTLGVDFPGSAPPPTDERKPLKSRTEATRSVTELLSRAARESDAAAFTLSEETRVVGVERLVEALDTLR